MAALAQLGVRRIRTYSALGAAAYLPEIAARHGITVLQGVWIDASPERRRQEIDAAAALSRRHNNITGLIAGSEALLREEVTPAEIQAAARELRTRTGLPIGYADAVGIWTDTPNLRRDLDFAVVHILPYWGAVPLSHALGRAQEEVAALRRALTGMRLVVGETGWPSGGMPAWGAPTNRAASSEYLRRALDWLGREGIETYAMEAFDSPWKTRIEGSPGPYWGILDADRQAKLTLTGPIQDQGHWLLAAALTTAAGAMALLAALIFTRWRSLGLLLSATVGAMSGAVAGGLALAVSDRYLSSGEVWLWAITALLMILLLIFLSSEVIEAAGVMESCKPTQATHNRFVADDDAPVVSIHIPTYSEPPEVVIESLEALARLDWPLARLEVIVLDNNTPDPALYLPVAGACTRLNEILGAEVFRFFHLDGVKGFKGGALDEALARTRQDATVIGVIDADYIVSPEWLRKAAMPIVEDPRCAFSQAPQAHRDQAETPFKAMVSPEYDAFFQIGMVERARDHAHILHGTMVLVRREALEAVGGWKAKTITEDAELGLRLQAAGWRSAYTPEILGRGLLPGDLPALKQQRTRWAYGGARIAVEHAKLVLGRGSLLTLRQRLRWLAGWAPWAGEGIAVLFAALAILWTAAHLAAPQSAIQLPEPAIFLPALLAVPVKLVLLSGLRRLRVEEPWGDALRGTLTGLALAPTHGIAFLRGLVLPGLPFRRTPKGSEREGGLATVLRVARTEALFAAALLCLAVAVAWRYPHSPWSALWAVMLAAQAMPFLATLAVAAQRPAVCVALGREDPTSPALARRCA